MTSISKKEQITTTTSSKEEGKLPDGNVLYSTIKDKPICDISELIFKGKMDFFKFCPLKERSVQEGEDLRENIFDYLNFYPEKIKKLLTSKLWIPAVNPDTKNSNNYDNIITNINAIILNFLLKYNQPADEDVLFIDPSTVNKSLSDVDKVSIINFSSVVRDIKKKYPYKNTILDGNNCDSFTYVANQNGTSKEKIKETMIGLGNKNLIFNDIELPPGLYNESGCPVLCPNDKRDILDVITHFKNFDDFITSINKTYLSNIYLILNEHPLYALYTIASLHGYDLERWVFLIYKEPDNELSFSTI